VVSKPEVSTPKISRDTIGYDPEPHIHLRTSQPMSLPMVLITNTNSPAPHTLPAFIPESEQFEGPYKSFFFKPELSL